MFFCVLCGCVLIIYLCECNHFDFRVYNIMVFINKFLFSYGYGSVTALMQSMFPSTKYVGVGQSLALSSFWGLVCSWLGLWPMLALAMLTVMAVELVSGIVASHVRKEHFESAKFSRFMLKLCIWFMLFVSCQMFKGFASEYDACSLAWLVGAWFFDVLTVMLMVAFVVEHATSIMENMACIDGKDKGFYIEMMKKTMLTAYDRLIGSGRKP